MFHGKPNLLVDFCNPYTAVQTGPVEVGGSRRAWPVAISESGSESNLYTLGAAADTFRFVIKA